MKRIFFLFVVSFVFVCSASAQFGTPYLAKADLSSATSAAQSRASDAVLYGVVSDSVKANGTASLWIYEFYSQMRDSIYGVSVVYGFPVIVGGAASSSVSYSSIGTSWVNSDAVMTTAEANGGSTFRSTNPNPTVLAVLGKGEYSPDLTKLVWLITYTSGSNIAYVYIDALTGAFLSNGTNAVANPVPAPASVQLQQNYPNPFNASTAISFTLNSQQNVTLAVYNELGEQVAALTSGRMDAGAHSIAFDASNLPEGVYFYKLTTGGITQTRRMTVVK